MSEVTLPELGRKMLIQFGIESEHNAEHESPRRPDPLNRTLSRAPAYSVPDITIHAVTPYAAPTAAIPATSRHFRAGTFNTFLLRSRSRKM